MKETGRRERRSIEDRLYHLLGENDSVPLDWRTLAWRSKDGCDRVLVFLNDGFEIGIGYPHEWQVILSRKDFDMMIRWYLRQWAVGEWFGLRRALWYRLLNRRVERSKRAPLQGDTEGTQTW